MSNFEQVECKRKIKPRLLRVEQAAAYLGISPKSIRNRLSDGSFPIRAKRLGRVVLFDKRDLDRMADELPYS